MTTFKPATQQDRATEKMSSVDRAYEREQRQQYFDFYGQGENKYGIYPPVWSSRYGKAPLIGIVCADNEFLAAKLAYDRGLCPSQCLTPKVKFLGSVKKVAEARA